MVCKPFSERNNLDLNGVARVRYVSRELGREFSGGDVQWNCVRGIFGTSHVCVLQINGLMVKKKKKIYNFISRT